MRLFKIVFKVAHLARTRCRVFTLRGESFVSVRGVAVPSAMKTKNHANSLISTVMKTTKVHSSRGLRGSFLALGALLSAGAMLDHAAAADNPTLFGKKISGVPSANPEAIIDNVISPEFGAAVHVQGLEPLENPSGLITQYGYLSDGTHTEPDENTYLILDHNPGGPTAGYDYGRHFLFQGHENSGNRAYITRVNLDVASPDHRITLMSPVNAAGFTGG